MKPEKRIVVILNNIRSLYNVGSIFRTSDAIGDIDELYLCGFTGTPAEEPNKSRIAKTALAASESTRWTYRQNAFRTAKQLKAKGYYLVALELTETSVPLHKIKNRPLAIVVGHERDGVDKSILEICDEVLHIPMRGVGTSMNVASAYAIGAYAITS